MGGYLARAVAACALASVWCGAWAQTLPVPSNPGPTGITFTDDQNVWFAVGCVIAYGLGFIAGQQR